MFDQARDPIAFRTTPLTCPCGREFVGAVVDGLHVSRRPDLRARIVDGRLHRYPCPSCGVDVVLERTLLYTDFPRRHWFAVVPPAALRVRGEVAAACEQSFQRMMVERAPALARRFAGEMIRRVVFGMAALREKLILFDAGLDDRRVELLKLQLFRAASLVLHPETHLHLVEAGGEMLWFEYAPPGAAGATRLPVPSSMYERLLAADEETLREDIPEVMDGITVDYRAVLVRT